MENIFYVYAYLDTTKPGVYNYSCDFGEISLEYEPFYIGKGNKKRINKGFYSNKNKLKVNKIAKIKKLTGEKPIAIKLYENLTESEALVIENNIINILGKRVDKTGILVNYTNGGVGNYGFKHSEKTKKLLSELNKGKKHSIERKKNLKAKNRAREVCGVKVYQYTSEGIFLNSYNSIIEAAEYNGLKSGGGISKCCRLGGTCCGYQWFYTYQGEKIKPIVIKDRSSSHKKIGKFNLGGDLIKIYQSQKEAGYDNNIHVSDISECCHNKKKQIKGFIYNFIK